MSWRDRGRSAGGTHSARPCTGLSTPLWSQRRGGMTYRPRNLGYSKVSVHSGTAMAELRDPYACPRNAPSLLKFANALVQKQPVYIVAIYGGIRPALL